MPDKQITREVSAREALESIRGPMTNVEVMQKLKLTPDGYVDLLRQLFEKGLITAADLERRGIRFKVRKKEDEPVQVEQVVVPAPAAGEDFPDTNALTDLLTFKTRGQPSPLSPPPKRTRSPLSSPPGKEEPEPRDKKMKLNIGGFFKKDRERYW